MLCIFFFYIDLQLNFSKSRFSVNIYCSARYKYRREILAQDEANWKKRFFRSQKRAHDKQKPVKQTEKKQKKKKKKKKNEKIVNVGW